MRTHRNILICFFVLIFFSFNENIFSQYQTYVDTLTRVFNTTSTKVGTLPGAVNVSSLGAATYRIPVFVSPGTAGVQPAISIVYNSLGNDGLLGKGWDIEGLSEIRRVPQNFYNDARVAGISLTSNDRFALDSNRLIVTIGTYGVDLSEYATEIETYSKIIAHGTAGTGPSWFEVTRKDGWKLEYGNTTDSKIEAYGSSTVYMWRINKISDLSGNTIKYYYTESGGESYVSHIDYTTNDAAGLSTPYNSILFDYTTRTDPNVKYIGGGKVPITALLTQIRMQTEGNSVVRKYQFKYFSGAFGKTFLNEIFEYGSDNTNKNSTLIVWGASTEQLSSAGTFFFASKINNYTFGDFNGDGRTDFVVTEKKSTYTSFDKWQLYLSDANGLTCSFKNEGYLSSTFTGFYVADVDGDRKDELLWKSASTVTYPCNPHLCTTTLSTTTSLSSENSAQAGTLSVVPPPPADTCWDYCSINQVDFFNYSYNEITGLVRGNTAYDISFSNADLSIIPIPGDFDGDGKTDYLFITSANSYYTTRLNGVSRNGVSFTNANDVRLVDFDGDGRKEIQVITGNNSLIYQYNTVSLSFASIYSSTTFPTSSDRIFTGDFNGDRKTDILSWRSGTGWKLKLSTGATYTDAANQPSLINTDPNASLTDNNYYIADFNGDHLDDILETYKSGANSKYNALYSRGNGLFFNESGDISSYVMNQNYFMPGDFNGDGKKDLFYCNLSASGLYTNLLSFHKNEIKDYVILIANGLNHKTRISYRRLNDSPLADYYLKGTDAVFPVNDYKGPYYCVRRIITDNGIGELEAEYYFWTGAKIHRQGKGFLGFTGKVQADIIKSVQTYETFELNTLFNFMTLRKSTRCKTEVLNPPPYNTTDTIKVQTNYYSIIDYGNKRIFPYISKIRNSDKLLLTTLNTYLTYDNYGNLTKSRTVFRNEESGQGVEAEKLKINNYAHSGGWGIIPNRLISTTDTSKYSNETAYTRTKSFTYDASGRLIIENTDPTLGKCVTTTHTLNSCGLDSKIEISASGLTSRSTVFEYDAKFRYVTKVTDPSGAWSTKSYYPGTGNVNSETTIDGLTTTYTYDGFGRLSQTTTPQGNAITHSFNWDNNHVGGIFSLFYEITDAANQPYVKVYNDLLGREVMTESENPNGSYSQITEYNPQGMVKRKSLPTDEIIGSKNFEYDSYGRLIKDMVWRGSYNTYTYNGKETIIKRNNVQEIKKTKTNSLGDIISSSEEGFNVSTSYFSNGKPKQMNADGTIVTYHYDAYGNNDQITNTNSGTTIYTYNAFGELLTQKDANNKTITFTYDVLGRISTKSGPDGTVTYTYVTSGNGKGQVQSISGPGDISIAYAYDIYGRKTQLTRSIGGVQSLSTTFGYDSWNNNTSVTYPSGIAITNVFSNGYMTEIKRSDNTPIWKLDSLNFLGQPLHYTLNGNSSFMQRFSYDRYHNLSKKIINATSIQAFSYDTIKGNLQSRKYSTGGGAYKTETFSYDSGSRLTGDSISGQPNVVIHYTQGNIISKTAVGTYSYNTDKINRLDNLTTTSSLIPSLSQSFVYNADNLTTKITQGTSTLDILYGPDGQRVKTIQAENGTTQETKYYSVNYEKEIAGSTTRELNYIYCPYGMVAMIIKQGTTQTTYYVETDHQGSIIGLLNTSGTYAEKYSYDAWGRRRNTSDWSFNNVTLPTLIDRGYTGHEHLDKFGIINMNGRMYDPYLGRFLSVDPVIQSTTNSQTFNGYSYCLNNPLKFTDPTGYSYGNDAWTNPYSAHTVAQMWLDAFGQNIENPFELERLKLESASSGGLKNEKNNNIKDVKLNKILNNLKEGLPAAITWAAIGSSEGLMAGQVAPAGFGIILRGPDKFAGFGFSSCGLGAGWVGADGSLAATYYFYTGDINNFDRQSLSGQAWDLSVSYGEGWSVGVNIAIAQDITSAYIIGIGPSVGVGVSPTFFTGQYSMTLTNIWK